MLVPSALTSTRRYIFKINNEFKILECLKDMKYAIKLRQDGWFEAGKGCKDFSGIAYQHKQIIKKELESITPNKNRSDLEEAIGKIEGRRPVFKGNLYVEGNHLFVDTPGLPGKCALALIEEVK
jgi:hypothetical protein